MAVAPETVLKLPARSFIGSPADAPPGLTTEALVLVVRETAFVELHCWNVGFPEGPAYPLAFSLGMGSPQGTVLAGQIILERIMPALQAARSCGLTVLHVQPEHIAKKHPQSQWQLEPRRTSSPLPPAALPGFQQGRADRVHGQGYREWAGWETMDIPCVVYPLPEEGVIITGAQFDRQLRARGIVNLIYTGFATNLCILDSPAVMKEMQRYGYRCLLLRDCTLAVEFSDTLEDLTHTRVAIRAIEKWVGATVALADFLASCMAIGMATA